ncbi:MAG: hypothetical protein KGL90_00025 [Burkholderiales bacterium]|nr:hypothetical protein [Burkholderiales bacterium]
MMSKSNRLQAAVSIAFFSLGLTTSGCASSNLDEWRTVIPCGGLQYVVTSHCKASNDTFELNTCQPGQQLAIGNISIELPSTPHTAKKPSLFATHWQCVTTDTGSFLSLDFSSGTGRTADDEAVEFYDKQLRRVTDEAIIRSIYKHSKNAPEGYVKSIYPGEGS